MLVYDASLDDDPELVAGRRRHGRDRARRRAAASGVRGPARGAARLARAHRRRRRRGAAAARAQPPRRRAAAARLRRAAAADDPEPHPRGPGAGGAARQLGQRRALPVAGGAARARARDPSRGAQPRAAGRAQVAGLARERRDHGLLRDPGAPARAGGARGVLRRLRGAGQRRQVRAGDADDRARLAPRRPWRSSRSPTTAIGGADESAGTGLQGLADRVAALDGTLRILSPPGRGTVVTAELPCES